MRTHTLLFGLMVSIVLCTPHAASANDGAFGGAGGSLIPLKNKHVAMLAEDITLEVVPTSPKKAGDETLEWRVSALYTFQNTSEEQWFGQF